MSRRSRSISISSAAVLAMVALAFFAGAQDATYTTKVYTKQGGDTLVVASGGTFHVETGGTVTLDAGSFCNPESNFDLDDGSGASPSLIFTDETDETATFAKADAGFLGLTTEAGDGLNVLVGNLKVGNGTPTVTQDGEDGYVEGSLEVDGTTGLTLANSESISNGTNGALTLGRNDSGTVTVTAADDDATAALTVLPGGAAAMVLGGASMTSLTVTTDGTGTAEVALPTGSIATAEVLDGTLLPADDAYPGRGSFTVCGDLTTVNNNTVYYGPSMALVESATVGLARTCNTAATGNTTEATADTPAYTATAFQILALDCIVQDAGATVSFTARSAAAATTPSVTCSAADNELGCVANTATTTAIASGATFAIAAASTADMGDVQFICTVNVAY